MSMTQDTTIMPAQASGAASTASAAAEQGMPRRGSEVLFAASAHLPPEKLKLLRALLAHACQHWRDRLFDLSEVQFSTRLDDLSVRPVQELDMHTPEWLIALSPVRHHNMLACIGMDAGAINLFIEALLGGGAEGRNLPGPRPWTSFDRLLAGQTIETFINALQEALAPSLELEMTMSEIQPGDAVQELALEDRPLLVARLRVEALGEQGIIHLVLPPTVVAGLRACQLQAEEAAEEEAGESPWAAELGSQLQASEVVCRAVLDGGEIALGAVAELRVGQVLELQTRPDAPVRLECDGETLFHCELGQADGMFVLRLQRPGNQVDELVESMIDTEGAQAHDGHP